MANEIEITRDGDTPFVDTGVGENVYQIPVQWLVNDIVKVRANSLEDAVKTFLKYQDDIPLGVEPDYVDGSYNIAVGNVENFKSEEEMISSLTKDIRDNYGEDLEEPYEYDDY
jgi:hypothetical protein